MFVIPLLCTMRGELHATADFIQHKMLVNLFCRRHGDGTNFPGVLFNMSCSIFTFTVQNWKINTADACETRVRSQRKYISVIKAEITRASLHQVAL
jgi:hypothetical protein